jgi:hypothetical protein
MPASAAAAEIAAATSTATAAASTAAATIAAAAAEAATTTTTATAAASAAIFTRARFVDVQSAAIDFLAVELLDGSFALFFGRHLDEAEAARASRLSVFDD